MSAPSEPRRRSLAPEEGWLTLALTMLLAVCVAWSINDAQWVLGQVELTDFLPIVAVLGVLWGFIGGKVGWKRWLTYLLGAVVGALLVPIVVGFVLDPAAGGLGAWFRTSSDSAVNAYLDLAWRNKALTQEYGHFMLVLGLLVWATGMFAGYATFGRHRPVNAIVITGLVLLANMAITDRDQIWFLVIYTLAALLILVRLHASDERLTWIRRRLGDPAGVSSLYVRGGVVFAVLAILGSLVLTTTASSAPLADVWSGVDQRLIDLSQGIQRFLPRGGPGARITGVSFGPQAAITGRWVTDTSPALRIQLPAGDTTPYYWRATAYDRFDLSGWSMSDNVTIDRAASSALLDETSERPPTPDGRREIAFMVEPLEFHGSSVFSPDAPSAVDRATRLTLVGPGEYLGAVDMAGGSEPYRVTALIATTGDGTPGALTENRLRAAGQDYPALVRSLYLAVPDGAVGPDTLAVLESVRDAAPLAAVRNAPINNPYDLARATEQYLRSPAFVYTTDVSTLDCGDRSVSECFAHFRRGYCQYYASLMVMVMRTAGVPARLVQGFLPGDRDQAGEEIVRFSNSHAWVEVYFPGYGWIPFDPTGGGLAQLAPLPSGAPVPIPVGTPRPVTSSGPRDEADPTRRPGLGAGPTTSRGAGSGPLIAIGVLLGIAIALLAFAAYRRGPRGIVTAESAYGDISRLAARFGFAPRPTETVYEYTGSLAEALPGVRPELETVAQAKVEVSYGHRELGADRVRSVVAAQRRLRVALLRLIFRRTRRR
jgi:hypothetical protein